MSKLQLHIQDRRGKALTSLSLHADATTDDLKKLFEKECQTHSTAATAHTAALTRAFLDSALIVRCFFCVCQTLVGM